jgi:hypothetical protein
VNTPSGRVLVVGAEHAQAAEKHRHFRRRQAEQRRPVEQQLLGPHAVLGLEVVAETVRRRLHHREAVDVGPFLRRVAAAAGEGHLDAEAGVPRRFLDRRRAGKDDGVRHRQAAAQFVDLGEHRASSSGSLTAQSFCGARRMRAPLAPPRWSDRR